MRTFLVLVCLLGMMVLGQAADTPSASQEGPVWFWQTKGSGQRMNLEMRLDNKVIFTSTFSIAHSTRSEIPKRSYTKKIRFSFKPERSILWNGYRDEDVASPAKQRIECDIWMAGADESVIILGVSFYRPGTILMNTLHLLSPTGEERSVIADGLIIITTPVAEKQPNKSAARTRRPAWQLTGS